MRAMNRFEQQFRGATTLQEQINHIFGEGVRHTGEESNLTPWAPAVDIYETENELVIKADMPDVNPQLTTQIFVEATRRAGVRAIISRGWADFGAELPEHCLAIGSVSHPRMFERVAAIVHHGGAGTTAAATRAGKPQLVVPHIADQFYFGNLVNELGIAVPPLRRTRRRSSSTRRSPLLFICGRSSTAQISRCTARRSTWPVMTTHSSARLPAAISTTCARSAPKPESHPRPILRGSCCAG